jgi:flagellar motor switch protein FliG
MGLTLKNIKGREKAAILLATIGSEGAARILQELTRAEIETLAAEVSDLSRVRPELVDSILRQAFEANLTFESDSQGGVDYAREILTRALEPEKAEQVLTVVREKSEQRPFRIVEKVDLVQLVNFLSAEHPQTVALILAHLDPRQAAAILLEFPEATRGEIVHRLATFEGASPDIVKSIEEKLADRLTASIEVSAADGGVDLVAEILNYVGKSAETQILDAFVQIDAELAQEIKDRMFTFDDLVRLDDRSIQTLLREVDAKMLALSLKGCGDTVREAILRNMSKRAAEAIREEMDYMGPVRVSDVQGAHRKILDVVSRLETEGAIFVSGKESRDAIIR